MDRQTLTKESSAEALSETTDLKAGGRQTDVVDGAAPTYLKNGNGTEVVSATAVAAAGGLPGGARAASAAEAASEAQAMIDVRGDALWLLRGLRASAGIVLVFQAIYLAA